MWSTQETPTISWFLRGQEAFLWNAYFPFSEEQKKAYSLVNTSSVRKASEKLPLFALPHLIFAPLQHLENSVQEYYSMKKKKHHLKIIKISVGIHD